MLEHLSSTLLSMLFPYCTTVYLCAIVLECLFFECSSSVVANYSLITRCRLFDALEPMYIALETHKESTERLEGLMMDLSRTLQQQQAAASMGKV